jgi:hypothetical protein
MEQVKIVKHENPQPVYEFGDILLPFNGWAETRTGAGWFSAFPQKFYEEKYFIPLYIIQQNSWEALAKLGISYFDFKDQVAYECPYTGYLHYWAVPTHLFMDTIGDWLPKCSFYDKEKFCDLDWAKKFHNPKSANGLKFKKVQRSLLGSGFTESALVHQGYGNIHDAILSLESGDFLGCKVWVWFSKNRG